MTTNIHDYSQAEAIILSVDSVSTVVAGLPLIDPTPAPNTVPMSLDTGNIDPAWFDTPDFNLSEIAGSSGGVDMTPIPKSTVKVQAPSGSDIVALGLLADREDILVIATQDSICLDVKPLAKPTSDQLLRSRQIRLALLPRVTLHNLTSLDNSVTVPAHLSAKLPTTSGGSLSAGDLWLITLDWVEGRFKSQPAGWHMTEVFGPYELGVGPAEPSDDLLLDGAIAVFPINSGNPDGTEALPDATYFPAGVRYYVGDISTNASKAYVVPFLWGMQHYTSEDKSLARLEPLLTNPPATLSEGNARVTVPSRGIQSFNKSAKVYGKWYFEIYLQDSQAFGNGVGAGMLNGKTVQAGQGVYRQGISMGFFPAPYTQQNFECWEANGGGPLVTGPLAVGDTFGIAYDVDNLVVYIYLRGNLIRTIPGAFKGFMPGAWLPGAGRSLTFRFHAGDFVYAPPAGFLPWSGNDPSLLDPSKERISTLGAGSPLVLSNGNKTITAPAVGATYVGAYSQYFHCPMGIYAQVLGKWYWEVHLDSPQSLSDVRFGLAAGFSASGTAATSNSVLVQLNASGTHNVRRQEGVQNVSLTLSVGDTIGVVYDVYLLKIHFYHNGILFFTDNNRSGAQHPVVELCNQGTVTCVFHAEDFRQAIPAGHLPWAC